LSRAKQPPEGGGLIRRPDVLICETLSGLRRASSSGVLLWRRLCRMTCSGRGNPIEITSCKSPNRRKPSNSLSNSLLQKACGLL
jgi:hypothetical protein